MVYSTRRFVLYLALCYFVLVFFSPFSIAITSLGEERASFDAFCTFVHFALWFCLFPFPLCVSEGLLFVFVAFPGLFSYLCLGGDSMADRRTDGPTDGRTEAFTISQSFFFLKSVRITTTTYSSVLLLRLTIRLKKHLFFWTSARNFGAHLRNF